MEKYGQSYRTKVDIIIDDFRNLINDLPRIREEMIKDKEKWYKVCSSMDVVGHTEAAIKSYVATPDPKDLGELYLYIYGLFQAMVVQQDAVKDIFTSLDIASPIKNDAELREIRNLRNDCIGHPTTRNRGVEPRSNSFYSLNWSKDHFTLNRTYYGDKDNEIIEIYPRELIKKQRGKISQAITKAIETLKEKENIHREKFKENTFQSFFKGMNYNFEKVITHFSISDHSRFVLAGFSFKELVKGIEKFKEEAALRKLIGAFPGVENALEKINHPIDRLDEYFERGDVCPKDANSFARDFEHLYDELYVMAGEIDSEYQLQL